MKNLILPMLLCVTGIGMAQAAPLRMTVAKPHFTCEGRDKLLSQAAYVPGADAPLPCCDGKIGCAQFLSTDTIVRPDHPQRG